MMGTPGEGRMMRVSDRQLIDLRWSAIVGSVSLALLILINLPYLASYAVKGDDFALILHSARFFSPSPAEWLTRGYEDYNVNYPELDVRQANFLRPTINASVYMDSWLAQTPRSVAMLATNYAGHAMACGLVFLVSRRIFGLTAAGSLLASALFAASPPAEALLRLVAFRGDMVATVFALLALLVMHSYLTTQSHRTAKLVLMSGFLTLSVFAKETTFVAPLVVALYALWPPSPSISEVPAVPANQRGDGSVPPRSVLPGGERLKVLAALAVPLLAFALVRIHAGLVGNYVLSDLKVSRIGEVPLVILNPMRFFATAFVPVETDTLKQIISPRSTDATSAISIMRAPFAIVASLLAWVAVLWLARHKDERRWLFPALALGLAASAVPILIKAESRFMYFGEALLVPLLVTVLNRATQLLRWNRASRKALLRAGATCLIGMTPSYFVARQILAQPSLVRENRTAAALGGTIERALRDAKIQRLYLFNTPLAFSPGLPALKFLAALNRRDDVRLRVVNELDASTGHAAASSQWISFATSNEALRIAIRVGPSQHVLADLGAESLGTLGEPGLIEYGPITQLATNAWGKRVIAQRELVFFIPNATRDDYVLVGMDPAYSSVHVYAASTLRSSK
jgi:hypothetical protein